MNTTTKIRRALISVTDKTELDSLAKALTESDVEILSSGGTAKYLREKGIPVKDVSEYTKFPEMMDGRLKTLHPKVHGGILGLRDKHAEEMKEHDIASIDLVVVNLYAFEKKVADPNCTFDEAIENIDIGGPTMLRSAAKNFKWVTVLTGPDQYEAFLREFKENNGTTSHEFRKSCALTVFTRTHTYDQAISDYLRNETPKASKNMQLREYWSLRYGENPHQSAGFYVDAGKQQSILDKVLQGKQLSYNNLLDVHAALDLIRDFSEETAVAILKHTNPCGIGLSNKKDYREAYDAALSCDPISAFGGIVVFNGSVDASLAQRVTETFTEIMIAPEFTEDARSFLKKKKNLRLLQIDFSTLLQSMSGQDIRRVADGYLVQDRDLELGHPSEAKIVTKRSPSEDELSALWLGWRAAKHVKSNAIVLAAADRTIGMGAGQMSRVDSAQFAVIKAGEKLKEGTVLASDAFFPFRDSIDAAAKAGIRAVIQPGGSIRDEEVIKAADEHGMAMLFTGRRHFRH